MSINGELNDIANNCSKFEIFVSGKRKDQIIYWMDFETYAYLVITTN